MSSVDCVVIGAGMGGLSAAAALARAGKKVLVLERHNVPGGYATTFVRGRFEFDVSLHWLAGLGEPSRPSALRSALERLDVARRLEFIPAKEFYRTVAPGFDYTLPFGVEEAERGLVDRFPADAAGIRRLFALMRSVDEELTALDPRKGPPTPSTAPTVAAWKPWTSRAAVEAHVKDPDFWLVFSQMANYFGVPHGDVSFVDHAAGLMLFLRSGASLVRGKSQALSQALAEVVRENGGEVRLGLGVSRILVRGGRAVGVLAEDGTEIGARAVVCNADPKTAAARLIGLDAVPSWYRRLLGSMRPAGGIFSVYLGLDAPPEELGLREHSVFVSDSRSLDADERYAAALRGEGFPVVGVGLANYSATDPGASPPGTTLLSLNTVFDGSSWLALSPREYAERRREVALEMIRQAESAAPGLRGRIEEMEIGTPRTNMRFTGNLGGSFQGFAQTRLAAGSRRIPARGPLEGLYFAGAWVNGGSFAASIGSGMAAAGQVLADRSPFASRLARRAVRKRIEAATAGLPDYDGADVERQARAVGARHPGLCEYLVREVIDETPTTKTFRLEPARGELPEFAPGQYLPVRWKVGAVETSRAYGISSARGLPWIDITVRRKEGGFVSPRLHDGLRPGGRLEAWEPSGSMRLDGPPREEELVLVAGGSGIAPLVSALRTMELEGAPRGTRLVYGSRREEDVIFREELERLAARLPGFRFDLVLSEPSPGWEGPRGFLDAKLLGSLLGGFDGKEYCVVGPAAMRELVESVLFAAGVPRRLVRGEAQGLPADPASLPGWPGAAPGAVYALKEARSGVDIIARADEPILVALERAGVAAEARCRVGECSYCRARLVSGRAFVPDLPGRRWIDEEAGYIHPCVAFPAGDLEMELRR